jgi:hypothetical protein
VTTTEPGAQPGRTQGNTFHGPAALQVGDHNTQYVQYAHQPRSAYRIEDLPVAPPAVRSRRLAEQPSRLLRATHQVVPFTGRHTDLRTLAAWRDDPSERLAVRLVHGPGGQGKTRLAAHFVELTRHTGWTVWQAVVNEMGADPVEDRPSPATGPGLLLVVDYAERWPTRDLHTLLRDPLLHRTSAPVRILLLARPSGNWWNSLATWIGDSVDAVADAHPLLPLATEPRVRTDLFHQARDRFAEHLGLPADQAGQIGPPADLESDDDYAQVLTIHIAALAAVDARLHDDPVPTDPARASAYLLNRERTYWRALHERASSPMGTAPETMARTVLTATLTRALARREGWDALRQVGLADSTGTANSILDDHKHCYPSHHHGPGTAVSRPPGRGLHRPDHPHRARRSPPSAPRARSRHRRLGRPGRTPPAGRQRSAHTGALDA